MDGSLPLSVQCELLGLNRSSLYYKPVPISYENVVMMNYIDRVHNQFPGFGIDKVRDRLSIVYDIKLSYKKVYSFMKSIDITYIGLQKGHTFMFAIIDCFSRMILDILCQIK